MSWLDDAVKIKDEDMGKDRRKHVPFSGDVMEGYEPGWNEGFWTPFTEFTARMKFQHFSRGRSSVKLVLEDENGITYEMFAVDGQRFIQEATLGALEGTWTFAKRGANYGLTFLE